jgi:hypothetical protein
MNQLVPFRSADASRARAAAGEGAKLRFVGFFARAYAQAVAEFLTWVRGSRPASDHDGEPVQVAPSMAHSR